MSKTYIAKRLPDNTDPIHLKPCEYCFYPEKFEGDKLVGLVLYVCDPLGLFGCCKNHKVLINKDETITVHPSILNIHNNKRWHGWLKNDVWYEC